MSTKALVIKVGEKALIITLPLEVTQKTKLVLIRERERERKKNISLCFSVISINAFPSIIDVVSLFLSLEREIERVRHLLPDLLELYIQCDQIGIFLKLLEQ